MSSQNSVGVNSSPNLSVTSIPPPQQNNISLIEQDKIILSEGSNFDFPSGSAESSITGSVYTEIEDEGPEDFILSDEEEFVEESFIDETISEPEDELQYQDFTSVGVENTIINKDLEKYQFVGVFLNNNKIKNVSCRLIDNKPVKEELIVPFMNMKEACLNEIKLSILITSAYRPAYEDILYNGKLIATSQKTLRTKAPSAGNLKSEYVGKFKNSEYDSTIEISTGKSINLGKSRLTYFIADTAPAGASNHGDGFALDLNTGSRKNSKWPKLNTILYTWLINNAWKYGFIRTVSSEEWHWEYRSDLASKGPYSKLTKTEANGFYKDLILKY